MEARRNAEMSRHSSALAKVLLLDHVTRLVDVRVQRMHRIKPIW